MSNSASTPTGTFKQIGNSASTGLMREYIEPHTYQNIE
jgi:hypothetical protein